MMRKQEFYDHELDFAVRIVREAARRFLGQEAKAQMTVSDKGKQELVTDLDFAVENYLCDAIGKEFPEDEILAEEQAPETAFGKRTWIIDPIDGTVNFSSGTAMFGIQAALLDGSEPVLSVILLPEMGEIYTAVKGRGAFCGGKPIRCNKDVSTDRAVVTFGDFSRSLPLSAEMQLRQMKRLMNRIMRFRMYGASCIDFTALASGKTHGHVMYSANLWDIVPGWFLAKEAGACSNYEPGSGKLSENQPVICAANDTLLGALAEELE